MYIDDWLSSKQIARMDAAEERGYLRLLMYAATEEDCGLPTNPHELANISLLGRQWFKPTADKTKRIGSVTSGEKLLACFVEKEGRLCNERLLREFNHQKEVSETKSAAGKRGNDVRWASQKDKKVVPIESQMRSHMGSQTESQTDPNDVCVCVSDSSSSKTEEASSIDVPGFEVGEAFGVLCAEYPPAGRTRKLMAQQVFCNAFAELTDRSPPAMQALFEEIMAGLRMWKASAQWKRGAVNHIANWLGERLWREMPISAEEASRLAEQGRSRLSRMPDLVT